MRLFLTVLWRIALQVDAIGYIICQSFTYNSTYQQNVPATQNLYLYLYLYLYVAKRV